MFNTNVGAGAVGAGTGGGTASRYGSGSATLVNTVLSNQSTILIALSF
jgi:hypothetical protein